MTNKLEKKSATEIPKEEAREILHKVNTFNPSKEDIAAFERLVEQKPNLFKHEWKLSELVLNRLLTIHEFSYYRARQTEHEMAVLREDLGFQAASTIEKLLIEQICINYLRLNLLENTHNIKTTESHDAETGLYWEKRLDTAHRRYMRSIETLAKVRKFLAEADFREAQAHSNRVKAAKIAGHTIAE